MQNNKMGEMVSALTKKQLQSRRDRLVLDESDMDVTAHRKVSL